MARDRIMENFISQMVIYMNENLKITTSMEMELYWSDGPPMVVLSDGQSGESWRQSGHVVVSEQSDAELMDIVRQARGWSSTGKS